MNNTGCGPLVSMDSLGYLWGSLDKDRSSTESSFLTDSEMHDLSFNSWIQGCSLDRVINGINRFISCINWLINRITSLIHGITQLVDRPQERKKERETSHAPGDPRNVGGYSNTPMGLQP